jgi:redox-sensing transcriptional repressor
VTDNPISPAIIDRLPRYYHYIQTLLVPQGTAVVSSAELAATLGIDDTLTRRDMSAVGVKGQPKIGYRCDEILMAIRRNLGFSLEVGALLVGTGRLGSAIASYGGFAQYGLRIEAVFDSDDSKIGSEVAGLAVLPLTNLKDFLRTHSIEIAILTVPAPAVQEIADLLIDCGVRILWNFAPAYINTPEDVIVRNELMSVGLAQLLYHIKSRDLESKK